MWCSDGGINHHQVTLLNLRWLKEFIEFGSHNLGVLANLNASDIMICHIVVKLVACEVELLHRFGYGVVFRLFGRGNAFGNVEMLFRVIDHFTLFAFGNYILIYEGIDCRKCHTKLFLQLRHAVPLGNARVGCFLGKV